MILRSAPAIVSACLLMLPSAAVQADIVHDDDVIINNSSNDRLCVGNACVDGENFITENIKINDPTPDLQFIDSNGGADWMISINSSLRNFFAITEVGGDPSIFVLESSAPSGSLYVRDNGDVGFGTGLPEQDLHVVAASQPTLRLEQDNTSGFPQEWDLFASNVGMGFMDVSNSLSPFAVYAGAPDNSLIVKADGKVGLGTDDPQGKLHTKGNNHQVVYIESADGNAVQVRFRTDSENRRFLAVNNANEVKSQLIFLDNSLKFTGQTDNGANLWMTVSAAGLVTQGPTCNPGPCDAVFDPEVFTPLPIEEHAALMWENRFLGAVGPTSPDQPVNLTEKMGGVIHELEVAHIYIEELHARLEAQDEVNATLHALLAAQNARLAALEAALAEK